MSASAGVVTTLTFVRTPGGVVRVDKGQPVPADALEADVERLVNAGVIVTAETGDKVTGDRAGSDAAGTEGSGEAPGEGGDPAPDGDNQPVISSGRGRGKPKADS